MSVNLVCEPLSSLLAIDLVIIKFQQVLDTHYQSLLT